MPCVMKMKDGKILTVFDMRDAMDTVEDYAGYEIRKYIEEYVTEANEEREYSVAECERMEKDAEIDADHQRRILCDVREELDAISGMLSEPRLNREKLTKAVREAYRIVEDEL